MGSTKKKSVKKGGSKKVTKKKVMKQEEVAVVQTQVEETPVVDAVEVTPVSADQTSDAVVDSGDVKVKRTRTFANGSRPGPKGKRGEGDFMIVMSVLQNDLCHLNLVSREVLQKVSDERAGRKVTIQTTHWDKEKKYQKGTVRPAIIIRDPAFGKKSGVFTNPFFVKVAETVSA